MKDKVIAASVDFGYSAWSEFEVSPRIAQQTWYHELFVEVEAGVCMREQFIECTRSSYCIAYMCKLEPLDNLSFGSRLVYQLLSPNQNHHWH